MFQTMNPTMINIGEAKARLSEYARKIKQGETFILCDRNKPFAEIRPLTDLPRARRPFGLAAGDIHLPDDFNQPDPAVVAMFEGTGDPG